ncbi:AraC family transcriptional regulator [Chryseobacterium sp. PS-8]|uniref:AraC family transcriptional regulator n=1 Tax=Chryseobacterium indicum TaxID=2766954 RepID=A0ABS9CAA0_9FLAO|nr:AraC family transcriptional regulator [Chryseobacterium sp. PS-8]MCF2221500.1 AraC family transcriptional regulator [Chryseobacterium sp. PS-8]
MNYDLKENQRIFIKRYIIVYTAFFSINALIELKIYYQTHYLNLSLYVYLIPLLLHLFFFFNINLLMKISFRLLVNLVCVIMFLLLYIVSFFYFFPFRPSYATFYLAFPTSLYMVNTLKQTILSTIVIFTLLGLQIFFCFYSESSDIFILHKEMSGPGKFVQEALPIIVTFTIVALNYFYIINKTKIETYLNSQSQIVNLSSEQNNKTQREKKLEILYSEIITALEADKLYLDPYFSLDDLTEHLNSNKTYISNALNKIGETTFYEIVNQYRIKNVINNLNSGNHKAFKIIHLSKKAGFLHQPQFNKAFKKETGMSPTEYIRSLENVGR